MQASICREVQVYSAPFGWLPVNICGSKWTVLFSSHGMGWVESHWIGWD